MRRGRTLIFVFLILIIGAVVAYVAYNQFLKPPVAVAPANVEVYIAGQNIPQGAIISPELLATIKVAPENVVEVMYTLDEVSALVGKAAKFPLDQGVVITTSMVGDPSSAVPISGPSWASLIPSGMTAMSIPADRFSLSGYAINNGAHVNLNACFLFVDVDPTFQTMLPNLTAVLTGTGFSAPTSEDGSGGLPILSLGVSPAGSAQGKLELDPSLQQPYYLLPSEAQRPRMVCQTMLQDVVVMKLGNFSRDEGATIDTPSVPPTTDANGQPVQADPLPDIVTLIVTPQDSITLTYLINAQIQQTNADGTKQQINQTRFSMTLRNPTDQARQATEASTLQFLLSQYNIPIPAKLPYALQPAIPSLLSSTETIETTPPATATP
jgi:pilus assembly protein CpaB